VPAGMNDNVIEMETEPREYPVNKKLVVLVAIVLALLMVAICYVSILLVLRNLNDRPEPQLAQPEFPLPTPLPSSTPELPVVPVVLDTATPTAIPTPTPSLWRFISITKEDIGTFENVNDPSQKLTAKCIDTKRPAPNAGELYTLYKGGILKLQDGSKKYQRFEVID